MYLEIIITFILQFKQKRWKTQYAMIVYLIQWNIGKEAEIWWRQTLVAVERKRESYTLYKKSVAYLSCKNINFQNIKINKKIGML